MNTYRWLITKDFNKSYWLFYTDTGRLEPRQEFRSLVCKKCNKMDLCRALEQGIPADIPEPKTDRDVIDSSEGLTVVSARTKRLFESIHGVQVLFYAFPSNNRFFVMSPVVKIFPPPNGKVYTPVEPPVEGEAFQIRGPKCKKCGRIRNVTIRSQWFTFPEDSVLSAVILERRFPGVLWFASEEVIHVIRENKITGFRIQRF